MRALLDTNVFLWLQTEPGRLGDRLGIVQDVRNERLVSAVSSWEVAIKHGLGRLPLPEPPDRWMPARLRDIAATAVPVDHEHALAVAGLPTHHRDPFDRLLIAPGQTARRTDPVVRPGVRGVRRRVAPGRPLSRPDGRSGRRACAPGVSGAGSSR